jgi:dynein heavy chain
VLTTCAGGDKLYEEAKDAAKVQRLMETYLEDYNEASAGHGGMQLVFFKDAIQHVSRIARILRQPRGNALLVGVGGSGRQSLTRLVSAALTRAMARGA